jgi:hypothetical protein
MRPDNLHMMITGESDTVGAVIIHCDPKYPDAINSTNGKKLLQMFANNEKSVIIVTGDKRKILSHSEKDTQRIMKILKDKVETKYGKI